MKSKGKILIVDDEPINLEFFDVMLSNLGFKIEKAADGEEALQKVVETDPDLIILDNIMPRLTGWEVTKKLKQELVLFLIHFNLNELSDATHMIIFYYAKGREIMLSSKYWNTYLHHANIQFVRQKPGIRPLKGIPGLPPEDSVNVSFGKRLLACMKIRMHFKDFRDRDIFWQDAI